jgi:hypothetical protein
MDFEMTSDQFLLFIQIMMLTPKKNKISIQAHQIK